MENLSIYLLVLPTMEPTIILTIALVTMTAGLVGLLTPYKIFLLLSIGGWITLIAEFQDYPGIVVSIIGVIIFNLWFSTLGGTH